MSLMSKLLSILTLLSSLAFAQSTEEKVIGFLSAKLKQSGSQGATIKVDKITVAKKFKLAGYDNWALYFTDAKFTITQKGISKPREERFELFSNGKIISLALFDSKSGKSLKIAASPKFNPKYYTNSNLIAGHANAKNKIAVFSDPLCPYCTVTLPGLIKDAQKHPNTFALYLYHFPLNMHPAASVIVKCMVAAELKGVKNVAYRVYAADAGKDIKTNARGIPLNATFSMMETNEKRVLNEFNKALGTRLTIADINSDKVLKHILRDSEIRKLMLVNSTPTVYVNGEKDPSRTKYKKLRK